MQLQDIPSRGVAHQELTNRRVNIFMVRGDNEIAAWRVIVRNETDAPLTRCVHALGDTHQRRNGDRVAIVSDQKDKKIGPRPEAFPPRLNPRVRHKRMRYSRTRDKVVPDPADFRQASGRGDDFNCAGRFAHECAGATARV